MRTTIDKAGRVVIPKSLRDEIGLAPGPVEIIRDGACIRIEPPAGKGLVNEGRFLVIPASGIVIDDETVRRLRHADQR